MSRLPHENRNVVDRPDLQEYELNKACPVTGEVAGLENHHLWPRSFGTKSWWVELWDGTVVGNRINLSQSAHYRITVNKARIEYIDGRFFWIENLERSLLRWQPPITNGEIERVIAVDEAEHEARQEAGEWPYGAEPESAVVYTLGESPHVEHPEPGHECPTCKRRVPHPKKASSPKSKVFSTRIPLDDVETFNEIVDAAAEHHGLKSKPHHVYWTLLYAVTLLLQQEKGELPV